MLGLFLSPFLKLRVTQAIYKQSGKTGVLMTNLLETLKLEQKHICFPLLLVEKFPVGQWPFLH